MGRCILKLGGRSRRRRRWASTRRAGRAAPGDGSFLTAIGAGDADSSCMTARPRRGLLRGARRPHCQRNDGPWYWDETNQTAELPRVPRIREADQRRPRRPIIWWQIPFGVPSATPGGSADHYRDNRVATSSATSTSSSPRAASASRSARARATRPTSPPTAASSRTPSQHSSPRPWGCPDLVAQR